MMTRRVRNQPGLLEGCYTWQQAGAARLDERSENQETGYTGDDCEFFAASFVLVTA